MRAPPRARFAVIALALALSALGTALPAHACRCRAPSPHEAFEQADAVFEGRVQQQEDVPQEHLVRLRFGVVRTWKGPSEQETLEILTPRSAARCGYSFALGQSYLVYAEQKAGALRVSACGGSRPMAEAAEALVVLGAGVTPVHIADDAPVKRKPPQTKAAPQPQHGGCASGGGKAHASLAWLAPLALGRLRRRTQP